MNPGPPKDNHEDGPGRRNSNLVALAAVVVLVLLAYWAFTALEHSREIPALPRRGPPQLRGLRRPGKVMRPLIAVSFATASGGERVRSPRAGPTFDVHRRDSQ